MANIKSQKKRNITNEKAHQRNKACKSELKTAVRRVREAVAAGNGAEAYAAALAASRLLDKAASKGIIIADTKFEFGLDDNGTVVLMDEILTPDSSRFWPADEYKVGQSEPSFDKQFIRDWLESQPWNKKAPAPKIPQDVLDKTSSKYEEALIRLTGKGVTA